MKINTYHVFLPCRNSKGTPDVFPCNVRCNAEQYDKVMHLDAVCDKAEEMGYEVTDPNPLICDDTDPMGILLAYGFDDSDWKNAATVEIPA